MKKYIYIIGAALVSSLLLTGCKDFLVADNKTAGGQTAEQFFNGDATSLGVYAYSLMKPIVTRTNVYQYGTDLYIPSRGKTSAFHDYSLTPETSDIKSFYSDLYACINMANACIFYDNNRTQYTPEMRFVRSYCYYILSQQFGRVPYVLDYVNSAARSYPLTDLAVMYDGIVKDLEAAIADDKMAATYTCDGHATKDACYALLAKVCLAAGWDLGTKYNDVAAGTYTITDDSYFTKALNYAKQAGADNALTQTFDDKWYPTLADGGEEVLFSVQYDRAGYPGVAQEGGHGLQNNYGHYYGSPSLGQKYVNSEMCLTQKAAKLWDKGDLRYEATFMTTFYNADNADNWGQDGYYAFYNNPAASTLDIRWKYFPYYVTDAEVRAWLTANQDRMKKGSWTNQPNAYKICDAANTNIVTYKVAEDGTISVESTQTFDDALEGSSALNKFPCVRKWDDATAGFVDGTNTSNDYRDVILLHKSDIVLVAAEAAYMTGNNGAAEGYLNNVRTRAGLPATTISAYSANYTVNATFDNPTLKGIDFILDERGRELYAENERWMDLRRTKQLVRYNIEFNPKVSTLANMSTDGVNAKLYRPIPQAEINANDAITAADQNLGY
ncbi:MAG: RagB/SusD family nutrient uptake outer membrane protein [Paludibacteraceae bacterium]|nr:RagB/SusD family nutrient uptake outer membrane protein [Paludibacteraceae bacterium]